MDLVCEIAPCNVQQRTVCAPSFTLWPGFEFALQEQLSFQHVKEEQNNSMDVPEHEVQADKESILALTDDEEEANNHPPTAF